MEYSTIEKQQVLYLSRAKTKHKNPVTREEERETRCDGAGASDASLLLELFRLRLVVPLRVSGEVDKLATGSVVFFPFGA